MEELSNPAGAGDLEMQEIEGVRDTRFTDGDIPGIDVNRYPQRKKGPQNSICGMVMTPSQFDEIESMYDPGEEPDHITAGNDLHGIARPATKRKSTRIFGDDFYRKGLLLKRTAGSGLEQQMMGAIHDEQVVDETNS